MIILWKEAFLKHTQREVLYLGFWGCFVLVWEGLIRRNESFWTSGLWLVTVFFWLLYEGEHVKLSTYIWAQWWAWVLLKLDLFFLISEFWPQVEGKGRFELVTYAWSHMIVLPLWVRVLFELNFKREWEPEA